jgi:hypothetical protein
MDGRHSAGARTTILQAKHYAGSTFAKLKSALKKERLAIDRIRPKPKRYVLATSRPLTPLNKAAVAKVIGKPLKNEGDIFGPGDLNALLRKFPEVEKANIKLWLSGTAVLERVIRSAAYGPQQCRRFQVEESRDLRENSLHAGDGLFLGRKIRAPHSAMVLPEFQRPAIALDNVRSCPCAATPKARSTSARTAATSPCSAR